MREGSRWRRIVGTVLFDASLAIATLGIVRTVIGIKIDLGPRFPLDFGGPWTPFLVAGALFVAAASIRPMGPPKKRPNERTLDDPSAARERDALAAGPAVVGSPSRDSMPVRMEHERDRR